MKERTYVVTEAKGENVMEVWPEFYSDKDHAILAIVKYMISNYDLSDEDIIATQKGLRKFASSNGLFSINKIILP
jgi:hypothetical protein